MAKAILRKKNKAEVPDFLISDLLQSYGNQNSMLLAQNRYTDQWNRVRNKLMLILSLNCQQRRQEYTMKKRQSQGFLPKVILTGVK